jgi:hypothetical protein
MRALAVALVLAAPLAAPAAAGAVAVGLADQKAASYADPRARALGLRYARLSVPFDAATSEPAAVQAWIDAVQAAGMAPHIAFEHLSTDTCPGTPCTLPSQARYAAAVRAFVARFPQVGTYTTWNEANHQTQPTADRPDAVAGYYQQLRAACPSCTVVAGDVLDSGSYTRWLDGFLAASPAAPQLWGLHDYGDVTYGRTTGVANVLATVPGTLWIEETGGLVSIRNAAGRQTLSLSEADAARAIDRAFAIAKANPRIARMYVYHWRASPLARFDSGLTRPDGTLRPSYDALVRDLAAQAKATTTASWTARWSTVRAGRLNVTVRCRVADRVCRGRVSAALRGHALGKRTYVTSARHPSVTLRIKVAKTRRRAGRLVLRDRALRPAAALRAVALTLGRPHNIR